MDGRNVLLCDGSQREKEKDETLGCGGERMRSTEKEKNQEREIVRHRKAGQR